MSGGTTLPGDSGRRQQRDLLRAVGGRRRDGDGTGGTEESGRTKGVFCALYSDRGSHFWLTPKTGEAVDAIA